MATPGRPPDAAAQILAAFLATPIPSRPLFISDSPTNRKRTTWHREAMVSGIPTSDEAISTITVFLVGSSRVFKNALDASAERSSAPSTTAIFQEFKKD